MCTIVSIRSVSPIYFQVVLPSSVDTSMATHMKLPKVSVKDFVSSALATVKKQNLTHGCLRHSIEVLKLLKTWSFTMINFFFKFCGGRISNFSVTNFKHTSHNKRYLYRRGELPPCPKKCGLLVESKLSNGWKDGKKKQKKRNIKNFNLNSGWTCLYHVLYTQTFFQKKKKPISSDVWSELPHIKTQRVNCPNLKYDGNVVQGKKKLKYEVSKYISKLKLLPQFVNFLMYVSFFVLFS